MKTCNRCRNPKSIEEFAKHPKTKDGRQYVCRVCQSERWKEYSAASRERLREESRKYDAAHRDERAAKARRRNREHPAGRRNADRLFRYGLTPEAFEAMWDEQDGLCRICDIDLMGRCHIDHCHATGVVRGLLCTNCNLGLGQFRDNPETLRRAMVYLEPTPLF